MSALICSLPGLSLLFAACLPPAPFATGYVEGEYTRIAPVATARIAQMQVARGDRVQAGAPLFVLEQRDAEIALSEAEAALAKAESTLANLQEGKRPEEIRALEAALSSARAFATEASRTRDRIISLAERGAATEAQRDDAVTAAEVAEAKLAEAEALLAVARLPARAQEIAAARAALEGANAARDLARWHLEQRSLTAPAAGIVHDVIRSAGEIAGPAAPALTLLPDGAVKLRLYVPETEIAQIHTGSILQVHCDSCESGLSARVSYVSNAPEFTPPVIYSLENRQKLVYLVEAAPTTPEGLKPGQIVDVALGGSQ